MEFTATLRATLRATRAYKKEAFEMGLCG